jgi:hypothetical protein
VIKKRATLVMALVAIAVASGFGGVQPRLAALGDLRLPFEPNVGEIDPAVRFVARAPDRTLYFTSSGVVLALPQPKADRPGASSFRTVKLDQDKNTSSSRLVSMRFTNAETSPRISGGERLPGRVNYFLGNDSARWHTDVPTYSGVIYTDLYPGICLSYSGTGRELKGTYTVSPGADPSRIGWRYKGAKEISVDHAGNLHVQLAERDSKSAGELIEHAPVAWQEIEGRHVAVTASYKVTGKMAAGFKLSAYDRNRPLVIDPILSYSTYLGGGTAAPSSPADNGAQAIAVDSSGNMYVTGFTGTVDFPTASPEQAAYGGGLYDVFVTKIDPSGSTLIYSTYLGGINDEKAFAIAVDSQGSAYVTGFTQSPNFPTTATAFQPVSTTGILPTNSSDAFVTKLSPGGNALVYSTFLGGNTNAENGFGIAVDSSGSAYVTGTTASTDFPTKNPYQPSLSSGGLAIDAFVTKLSADGSALVYSTYLGGGGSGGGLSESGINEGYGIAVDFSGSAYVVGDTDSSAFPTQNPLQPNLAGDFDIFVTKFSPAGNTLVYSTYLGGSKSDSGFGIAVDSSGAAYITGKTASLDFPTVNAFQPAFGGGNDDAFVEKLNPDGSALVYSTYLGGSGSEGNLSRIAIDSSGNAYIVGSTDSTNFPTANAIQSGRAGPGDNAFITKLNTAGNGLVYSTYLGGNSLNLGFGIAVDASGTAYVAGQTWSGNFPTVNPFQGSLRGTDDAFIAKIVQLPVQLSSVVSRKTHGSAGTFDINLPLTGSPGIECRKDAFGGNHELVFAFTSPLTSVGGASVTSGSGSVSSSAIGSDPHQYIVDLTGVSNAQFITVSLTNVGDSAGNFSSAISATMGVLLGDVNASGLVDGNDVSAVQADTRQTANSTNFRLDVNTSGLIDGNDVSLVQSSTRTSLPSPP